MVIFTSVGGTIATVDVGRSLACIAAMGRVPNWEAWGKDDLKPNLELLPLKLVHPLAHYG